MPRSSPGAHLGYFHLGAVVNNAAASVHIHVFSSPGRTSVDMLSFSAASVGMVGRRLSLNRCHLRCTHPQPDHRAASWLNYSVWFLGLCFSDYDTVESVLHVLIAPHLTNIYWAPATWPGPLQAPRTHQWTRRRSVPRATPQKANSGRLRK